LCFIYRFHFTLVIKLYTERLAAYPNASRILEAVHVHFARCEYLSTLLAVLLFILCLFTYSYRVIIVHRDRIFFYFSILAAEKYPRLTQNYSTDFYENWY
jgi:hypothetical protein